MKTIPHLSCAVAWFACAAFSFGWLEPFFYAGAVFLAASAVSLLGALLSALQNP